jgi:biopolymer transport protein ExbD
MSDREFHAVAYVRVARVRPAALVFDAVPLLNVVLLLAIFALLASGVIFPSGLAINLPAATTPDSIRGSIMTIRVSSDERMFLRDASRTPAEQARALSLAELSANLQEFQRNQPDGIVLIDADVNVRHGVLYSIMEAVRDCGLQRMAFGAKPVGAATPTTLP